MPYVACVAEVSEQVTGLSPSRLSPIAKPTVRVAPRPKSTHASSRIGPHAGVSDSTAGSVCLGG
jgi:hypothetical protein